MSAPRKKVIKLNQKKNDRSSPPRKHYPPRRFRRGDVYLIRESGREVGCEMAKSRPGIIVSNNVGNRSSSILEIVYLTTKQNTRLPTHVRVMLQNRPSVAMAEQLTCVSQERALRFMGRIGKEDMRRVEKAICTNLGLNPGSPPQTYSTLDNDEKIPPTPVSHGGDMGSHRRK